MKGSGQRPVTGKSLRLSILVVYTREVLGVASIVDALQKPGQWFRPLLSQVLMQASFPAQFHNDQADMSK